MMAQNINSVNLKKKFFLNEIAQKEQLQFCDIHVVTGLYRPRFEKIIRMDCVGRPPDFFSRPENLS